MLSKILSAALLFVGSICNLSNAQTPFGSTLHQTSTITEMSGLGVKWVRIAGITGINWGAIESTKGTYNWTNADNTITSLNNAGINIFATVLVVNQNYGVTYGYKPADSTSMNALKNFLKKLAERYNGDGINDAPGSPVVNVWQINNEINLTYSWADTYQHYAEMLIESYTAIKFVSPNALVAMAAPSGPPGIPALQQVASYLTGGPYFDILDIHLHANNGGTYNENINNIGGIFIIDDYINEAKNIINITNPNAKLWIAETSIGDKVPSTQTEMMQSVDLIKEYIYYRVKGVDVILWSKFHDAVWNGDSTHYFSNNGLVNLQGIKKLSYYSYQLLLDKLVSADWSNIQTIQKSNNIHIYIFTKNGNPIYVAWNDSSSTRAITISGIGSNRVRATEAVPKYDSGKDVVDYTTAFRTDTLAVTNGAVTLTLGERPVFVEPLMVTSVENEGENVPQEFLLYQNYPNPFNPTTTIRFSLTPSLSQRERVSKGRPPAGEAGVRVTLKVFDVLGREAATLVDGELSPGEHSVVFDAMNLSSGVYFYRLGAGSFIQIKKMLTTK